MKFIIKHDKIKQNAIRAIESLKNDIVWEVEIKQYKRNRSASQNSLYWQWITLIGHEIGYDKDEMHTIFAEKYLPPVIVEYDGRTIQAVRSTKGLKVKEFSEYLEAIDRFAAELGIMLPHPADLYYDAMGVEV